MGFAALINGLNFYVRRLAYSRNAQYGQQYQIPLAAASGSLHFHLKDSKLCTNPSVPPPGLGTMASPP